MSDRTERAYSHDILSSEDVKLKGNIECKYRFEYLDLLHEYDKCESKWHSSMRLSKQQRESLRKQMAVLCKQLATLELSTPIQNILSRADVGKLDIELTFVENFKVFQYEFTDLGDLDIEMRLMSQENSNDNNDNTDSFWSPLLVLTIIILSIMMFWMAIVSISN